MSKKPSNLNILITNRKFTIFLISQGISNLGDAFQFIAATSLLISITGSGLSAAFGLICYPILSIIFSTFAGYISDAKAEKAMLIIIDMLRGITAVLFIYKRSIPVIYSLIVILTALEIAYNPPKRKMISGLLDETGIIAGNSLLNGITGIMFVAGPVLAGIYISKYSSANLLFIFNGASFFISAFLISIIKYKPIIETVKISLSPKSIKIHRGKKSHQKPVLNGLSYCLKSYPVRKIIIIGSVIYFAATCINMAFYPFAFDVLKITGSTWGIMMSVFYGANLLAMFIALSLRVDLKVYYRIVIPLLLIMISLIWVAYGKTINLTHIILLQLIEGTILAFINIILISHLQILSHKEYLGRVIGINDLINNIGKIIGIGCTYFLLSFSEPKTVFIYCGIGIITFAACTFISVRPEKLCLPKRE